MTNGFSLAHRKTAEFEGGLTDHVADRGGITKYGVSYKFLVDFAKRNADMLQSIGITAPITHQTIIDLNEWQAQRIFFLEFWASANLDQLPLAIAFCAYDMRVNHGKSGGTKLMQRAYNMLGKQPQLAEDGAWGGKTTDALSKPAGAGFVDIIVQVRKDYFRAIINNDASQSVFERGWMRRAEEMGEYAKTLI